MSIATDSLAQTLALLVIAEEQQPGRGTREECVYQVIGRSHATMALSEEAQADLYSLVVEHPHSTGDFFKLQSAFRDSLATHLRRYPHG
jgi:hypothetical protein